MPFDTITRRVLATDANLNIPIDLWAFHIESEPFRFNIPTLTLPAISLPEIRLPYNLLPSSTVAGILVVTLYLGALGTPQKIYVPQANNYQNTISIKKLDPAKIIKASTGKVTFETITPVTYQANALSKQGFPTVHSDPSFNAIYQAAAQKFGIPWQILAAVHKVETGQSGDTDRANISGATGPMQFKPTTFAAYATDGDGDGAALITDVHDAIFSAANLLARDGAANGNIRGALSAYCNNPGYVDKVLNYAGGLGFSQ